MNKREFSNLLQKKYLVLDGATGTFLQKQGMPTGVCPEQWALDNPEVLAGIHKSYADAGSDMVYSCTFGANKLKLKTFGLEKHVRQYNKRLVQLAKEAVGTKVLVAGSIGPTGQFIEPVGSLSFDEAVAIFAEQITGMLDGDVDALVIETMIDIQETRAALLAANTLCNLPVIVSLTYAEEMRTLTGTDPVTALITLQAMGADVVGTNCSTGPEGMLEIIKRQSCYATVPLMAKPNAGMPVLRDGQTVFTMTHQQFAKHIPAFMEAGVSLMGGCCGTTPDFIAQVHTHFEDKVPLKNIVQPVRAVTSRSKTVFFNPDAPPLIIGERINPTGKKTLSTELIKGKMTEVKRLANEQIQAGADILDVNVGAPQVDEKNAMKEAVLTLIRMTDLPLCIDSSDPAVIEEALKHYPGRALVNSLTAEKDKLDQLVPVIARYGAHFIFLPLDDSGIPKQSQQRAALVKKVLDICEKNHISPHQMVVDGLTMTVSADPAAARETLDTIAYCTQKLNLLTTIGLSNISFGLPERSFINSAFLAMAIENGLSSVIINPCHEATMPALLAASVLCQRDRNALRYIDRVAKLKQKTPLSGETKAPAKEPTITDCVISGDTEQLIPLLKKELQAGNSALYITNEYLIPGMQIVGEKFSCKELFLPQLMVSAETMQTAFSFLQSHFPEDSSHKLGKMLIATVKGDIHDIGKNIVALMLRNHGIDVLDLGKDVDADTILETARKEGITVVGLSALMTTTMTEMEEVIKLARKRGYNLKFVVGGAVITQEYADKIGAHEYAQDSVSAVKAVKRLLT
ncbi:MAG: 5-methyltetrahydrofolate--homocysteine methyltransferase [Candidatus Auribacter fodinae]|jgi:5-methyltetrahydrofolate--homocysteine methyltransferase|uniref:Methionine synthase n=1 Tax=Candidatus Auribacter fodinae TaxID=2093366 RepID=A0A3A4QVH3_9BACT|nr:MAG: 5-methyltetrahydrofolate--homocysteine methyltransferase [Candidatus Auribacter fodinae]